MSARLAALLPRLVALTVIGLLAATPLTFAAATKKMKEKEAAAAKVQPGPNTLRVPDVRGQAYVFAKGILEDAGFSWQVVSPVKGYAANLVALQKPAPGTLVLDNGAPMVELRLERNPDYTERGLPVNTSSFAGSDLRLASDPVPAAEEQPEPAAGDAQGAEPKPSDDAKESGPKDSDKTKENQPADEAKPADEGPAEEAPAEAEGREPDFVVPGAPAEPADEMALPDRARLVAKRVGAAAKPSPELVDWWLYQHSWIVSGAKFGWHDGAEALQILIRVDRSIEKRWGMGAKSTRLAKRTLAEVEDKAAK